MVCLGNVFEIASKYCISDSFVDHDGHSISSEGFLPAVVDIMKSEFNTVQFSHSVMSDSLRSQCKQILFFLLFTTPSLNLLIFFIHEIPKAYLSVACQFLINLLFLCLKEIIAACFGHFLGLILIRPPYVRIQICFFFSCCLASILLLFQPQEL